MSKAILHDEKIYQAILGALISEKSAFVAEKHNQIVFRVLPAATKAHIKRAVEEMFSVKVASVATLNVKGKEKRFRGYQGQRSDWKKAYVTLAEGHEINFGTA